MKLFEHARRIVDDNCQTFGPYFGLWLGTGSTKTRIALAHGRGRSCLVICPKTNRDERTWEREVEKIREDEPGFPVDLRVVSKEEFRRDWETYPRYDVVIGDEAHTLLGATPATRWRKKVPGPRCSQVFEALLGYVRKHRPDRVLLLTATLAKQPMTVWAAGVVLGNDWDWQEFRQVYYTRLPIPGREVWVAKKDEATRDRLARTIAGLGWVGRLEDWLDVPEQTYETRTFELTAEQKARIAALRVEYPEPIVQVGKRHQVENGCLAGDEFAAPQEFACAKDAAIIELADEFPKLCVVAKYTAQLRRLERLLRAEGREVFVLDGATADRGGTIAAANAAEACVLLVQAQVAAGWEIPAFPCMVFASMSYSVVDRVQAEGRILRANHLKKNLYVTLVARGGVDEAVAECVAGKVDFSERVYALREA